MLTLPGQLTPEAVAMHDDVVNKAKQVETSRAAVELSQQEIQAYAGHQKPDTTMLYVTVSEENVKASFRRYIA